MTHEVLMLAFRRLVALAGLICAFASLTGCIVYERRPVVVMRHGHHRW